jgi:hypothetical protein
MPNKKKSAESLLEAPPRLFEIQNWFASIITSPLIDNEHSQPTTVRGNSLVAEAENFLIPSPTLTPFERIQIYNQQYWWRLLNVLHHHFPFLTRLFGCWDFDQTIGVPYLLACPPDHWTLFPLGKQLPLWIKKHYHHPDRNLVLIAAQLDWAFESGFVANQLPPLNTLCHTMEDAERLAEQKLRLQPHISLFKCKNHYLGFREAFLEQEEDYWVEHDFPEIERDGPYYFAIFRNPQTSMRWIRIRPSQYFLLKQFEKGASLTDACQKLEEKGGELYKEAFPNIQTWFQEWTSYHWLCVGGR